MNNLDDDIRKALADGDVPYDFNLEADMVSQVTSLFRGKMRWWTFLVLVESVVFLVLIVLAVIEFNQTEDVKSLIFYASGVLLMTMLLVLVKLWSWMQMNRFCIQREIKRLELRMVEMLDRDRE